MRIATPRPERRASRRDPSRRSALARGWTAANTIAKLTLELGAACARYQDEALRELPCKPLELDELWGFCYSKQKRVPAEKAGVFGYGDVWTFIAIDADTKLCRPSWWARGMAGRRPTSARTSRAAWWTGFSSPRTATRCTWKP